MTPVEAEGYGAAGYLWVLHRALRWDDSDDPEDVALYQKGCEKARAEWPWLDKIADEIERAIFSDETMEEREQNE